MKKLWDKGKKLNEIVESYTSGENVVLDNELVKQDIYGSIAHAYMLLKIGILTTKEYKLLQKSLCNLLTHYEKGIFTIELGDEDVHTKIENYLINEVGEPGKKIHTGRSRNDQIQLDLRLYSKEKTIELSEYIVEVVLDFLSFAKKNEFIGMPGYTHMQKAMPSSIGVWSASFAESLLDDLTQLQNAYEINDQSPLGSGAAYGVSLPINRTLTSQLLGFKNVQNNVLYSQVSRLKSHLVVMQALEQVMLTLSRFAEDILLFTMSEFNFFTLPDELCTGSSIMPQKKNVDIMEILKARSHIVIGNSATMAHILSGLPSGYNSDYQESKKLYFDSLKIVISSLGITQLVIQGLKVNEKSIQQAMSNDLFATHAAYELVKKGVPFRDAYRQIASLSPNYPHYKTEEVLKETNHEGAPGNLMLKKIVGIAKEKQKWWNKQSALFQNKLINLTKLYE